MAAAGQAEANPRFEADCLTADGLRLRLGFTVSPLFSELGDTTGTVITFQDLTHIRALEETSRRQDRLAAIGRMAASIAHEIRNPLAAMRGSIQMLRADMEGESSQTELMEIILRESDRLNRIISDFLNYARPRSIIQSKVDVGESLRRTFTLLRNSAEINEKSNHQGRGAGRAGPGQRRCGTTAASLLESCSQCFAVNAGWGRHCGRRCSRKATTVCELLLLIPGGACRRNKWSICSSPFPRLPEEQDLDFRLSIKSFAIMVVQLTCAAVRDKERRLQLSYLSENRRQESEIQESKQP